MYDLLKEFGAEFGPSVTGFLPALSSEELLASLVVLQAEIESVIQNTGSSIRELQPPPEFAADHEVVLTFFDQILEVARDITMAAAEGDTQSLNPLFRQSGEVFCTAELAPVAGYQARGRPLFRPGGTSQLQLVSSRSPSR